MIISPEDFDRLRFIAERADKSETLISAAASRIPFGHHPSNLERDRED